MEPADKRVLGETEGERRRRMGLTVSLVCGLAALVAGLVGAARARDLPEATDAGVRGSTEVSVRGGK